MTDIEVRVEEERERFVALIDDEEAYLAYASSGDGVLDYRSTFVPEAHREQGIGEELVVTALAYAREHGYRVIPSCPFVAHVVEENPEYRDVLVPERAPPSG